MNYNEAKDKVFAVGSIPDGYFGDRVTVGFAFDAASGKTLAVHEHGYFTYHTPPAVDEVEALWLLLNHPSSNVKNCDHT